MTVFETIMLWYGLIVLEVMGDAKPINLLSVQGQATWDNRC